jgi:hypothetical protein
MGADRPRTFAEVVAAPDPQEIAALERADSYNDPAVAEAFLRPVAVFEDRYRSGEWRVEYFDDNGGCYMTVFAGAEAERRARQYFSALKGGQLSTIRETVVSH